MYYSQLMHKDLGNKYKFGDYGKLVPTLKNVIFLKTNFFFNLKPLS